MPLRPTTIWWLSGIPLVTVAVASCVSTGADSSSVSGVATGDTEYTLGRRVYRTKCAKCHAPEPVKRYSRAEWNEIMPGMIEETRLDPSETAAVWAYVRAELGG